MYHLGVILLLLVVSSQCDFVENSESVPNYLVRRFREAKVEIAKAFIQRDTEPVISSSYDIDCVKLWSEKLHSERTLMVSMFNKMCILEGNRLISIAVKPAKNKTSSALKQVTMIQQERSIKFAKSILWKSEFYLLVCHEDDNACDLYTGKNETLKHRQIIKDKGWPMDATFFTHVDHLYLVVAHNTDQFPGSSVIYNWTGKYMDVIYRFNTIGAISVTAFNYKNSTIIIFGQNEKRLPDIGSEVYEFHENGFDMIQYLPTKGPVNIHYYVHKREIFLVIINENNPANIYWWDGNEFLHWINLPFIVAPSIINIAHFNSDTLFFVSSESDVKLYKLSSSDYLGRSLLKLKNGERVVDMGVWIKEKATLTLLLITVDRNNLYRIEPWELRMRKMPENGSLKESEEATENCLRKLEARLKDRVARMESLAHDTWPQLFPSGKNINIGALNGLKRLGKLILDSGSIGKLDVITSKGILSAKEIETAAYGSRTIVKTILERSRKTMKINGANRVVGNVTIHGDAIFQVLDTSDIHTNQLNGKSIDLLKSVISATKNQVFSNAQLCGKKISVRSLQIDQLCGIPFEYWLRNANERSDNIFLKNNTLEIINDTIRLQTNLLSVNRLNLRTIDNVDLDHFFKDLFVMGERQLIKGNIIQHQSETLNVADLVVEELNGVAQKNLMTIQTSQNFENDVLAKTMLIRNLIAKKINGIAVSESAMVSKKNHIKGHVTIANIRILNELSIENPSIFPKVRPVQVYDQVTIVGNLKAENLTMEPYTNFVLVSKNGSAIEQNDIDSIFDSYWTKSTSQIIQNQVILDSGLTVDELSLDYLNDLNINEDIMLTTTKNINQDFGSLEFKNFVTNAWIFEETENPEAATPLWSNTINTLSINEELRIEFLGAQHFEINTFNGIPTVEIMKRNFMDLEPYEYPVNSIQRFDTITINERLETEELNLRFFNEDQREWELKKILKFDDNHKIKYLKAETLNLENIEFISDKTGNFSELQKFVEYIQDFSDSKLGSINDISLLIDGNLMVENNLQVVVINHKSTKTYLDDLVAQDFAVNSNEELIIDDLVVHGNLSVNLFQGSKIESLVQSTLSKSRNQDLSDTRFSFHKISVDDLRAERINQRYTKNFIYTDSYEFNFSGDVNFTNLILSFDEDTQTKSLNGLSLKTLYKTLGEIPSRQINDFTVNGNITWESRENSPASSRRQLGPLDGIIKSALVKNAVKASNQPQIIYGQIRINSASENSPGMFVRRMNYKQNNLKLLSNISSVDFERLQATLMREIIYDSVLDDPLNDKGIEIVGKKIFGEDLKTSRLNVSGGIDIESLNKWNVNDLKASIVRKESLSSLNPQEASSRSFDGRVFRQSGKTMIFRQDVIIENLFIQTNNPMIHGAPISAIFLRTTKASDNYLPNNTYLKHVEIKGNAFVKSLDNVDLDEFVNDRITIESSHEIHANLQFNGRVQVSKSAKIRKINGIHPSDFVINNSQLDQIIVGEKTFDGNIEIQGNVYAPSIGGINFKDEYDNGVMNDQDTEIFGDLIFKADIERPIETINSTTRWQLNPASGGFVNEIRLRNFLNDRDTNEENILRGLKRNESRLELTVNRASNATSHLPEIFYYFESQDDLKINAAKVDRVEVMKIEDLTILNMYSSELGSYCGLMNECPCRRQYVAEINSRGCDIRAIEESRIVYNFHEPHGAFGLNIVTTSVSSSKKCTAVYEKSLLEFTTISWTKPQFADEFGANNTKNAMKIYGYLSDVEVFTQNDLVFIVLAIYYDPIKKTHETNSLIYVLDLETNEIKLSQGIPTSHATGVQVFKIPSQGPHILFTSSVVGEFRKPSKSLLYRLDRSTAEFKLLRTFTTGGNRHAKSVSQPIDEFLFLDDAATNSIHVYIYNEKWDNFYFYQSLYHDSMAPISSIVTLYAGEFRRSQVYVIVTTKHDQFFVYEYKFFGKFQIIAQKKVEGILTMTPFDVSSRRYAFVGTETNSTVLSVIELGRH